MYHELTQSTLDAIAIHMDPEIREALHSQHAPCEPGFFLEQYLARDPDFPIDQFDVKASE